MQDHESNEPVRGAGLPFVHCFQIAIYLPSFLHTLKQITSHRRMTLVHASAMRRYGSTKNTPPLGGASPWPDQSESVLMEPFNHSANHSSLS
jgi:hypothetical protein